MIKHTLLSDLQALVNKIDAIDLPYHKGNHIRIGQVIITERKYDYTVYDKKNNHEYVTFCKTSAVALAKTLADNKNYKSKILELDKKIQKNYMDCMFFRNSLKLAKTVERKEILRTRYEIAKAETKVAKDKLDHFIF
jgi:hypothetical protein